MLYLFLRRKRRYFLKYLLDKLWKKTCWFAIECIKVCIVLKYSSLKNLKKLYIELMKGLPYVGLMIKLYMGLMYPSLRVFFISSSSGNNYSIIKLLAIFWEKRGLLLALPQWYWHDMDDSQCTLLKSG